jgi:outer membrane protein assembly factor BamD
MLNGLDVPAMSDIRGFQPAEKSRQISMQNRNPVAFFRRFAMALVALPLVGLLLAGCFGRGEKTEEEAAEPADLLYNQGLALLNAGETRKASDTFQEIDKQHPYSEYARRSMVMSAFLNFRRGKYTEAITEAERYVTLFPASPDAAYAQYLIGEAYFRQIPDVTRDQDLSQRAIEAMNVVVTKFPDSDYAEDARKKMELARDQIAGKEMQIGRYYLERREYLAAVNRFRNVVTTYQTTRHVEEALHRLTESYLALGIVPEAQTAAAVLGHNFPDSEWYQDSYALLNKGGLQPSENQGSWISRVFRGGADA